MWTIRDARRTSPARRRPQPVLVGAVVGMTAMSSGSMVIFPMLPILQRTLEIPLAAIGLLAAAGFAATLIAELVVAPQADRGHARTMGVVGVLLMAVALLGSAFATDVAHLMIARAVGGFGVGIFTAAATGLLVRTAPARSGELLGRFGAAELVGISLGPLLSGVAVAFASPSAIFAVAAVLVAGAAIPVSLTFREPRPRIRPAGAAPVSSSSLDLLRSRRVLGVILLQAAIMIPVGAYDAIWPSFMTDLGSGPLLIAASYALFAVPFVILAGWAGRLADRLGGARAFLRGIIILVALIALYAVVRDPYTATGMGLAESGGQALAQIGAAAAMAQAVPAARAGSAQGLLRAVGLVFAIIAAALSGVVYAAGGQVLLFGATAVIVAMVAAGGLLVLRSASTSGDTGTAGSADLDTTSEPALSELSCS